MNWTTEGVYLTFLRGCPIQEGDLFNGITPVSISMNPKYVQAMVIGITQPPLRDGAWSALFSNLSKSALDKYYVVKSSECPLLEEGAWFWLLCPIEQTFDCLLWLFTFKKNISDSEFHHCYPNHWLISLIMHEIMWIYDYRGLIRSHHKRSLWRF